MKISSYGVHVLPTTCWSPGWNLLLFLWLLLAAHCLVGKSNNVLIFQNDVKVESKVEKSPDVAEPLPHEQQQEADAEQVIFERDTPPLNIEVNPDQFKNQRAG